MGFNDAKRILLHATGRMGRGEFAMGMVGIGVFAFVMNRLLGAVDTGGATGFWIGLIYFPLFFYMIYCVMGKRLHDMGRSFWPLTVLIVLMIVVMFSFAHYFGGGELIDDILAATDVEGEVDPAIREAAIADYRAEVARANRPLMLTLWAMVGMFTLWLGLTPSQAQTNKYGDPRH